VQEREFRERKSDRGNSPARPEKTENVEKGTVRPKRGRIRGSGADSEQKNTHSQAADGAETGQGQDWQQKTLLQLHYIRKKTKTSENVGPLKNADGQLIKEPAEMTEELNRCFSDVFTRENVNNLPQARRHGTRTCLSNIFITSQKVKKKIKKTSSQLVQLGRMEYQQNCSKTVLMK
jgi:hypothetical protein